MLMFIQWIMNQKKQMEAHFKLNDAEFLTHFESCSLDPSVFSHEAHLRLAWLQISKHGIDKAVSNIQKQLQKYVAHIGAEDKYHVTLTVAATMAVYHFMQQSSAKDFKAFIDEFPQLKEKFRELIASHYGFDVFRSEKARKEFIEPDKIPFD